MQVEGLGVFFSSSHLTPLKRDVKKNYTPNSDIVKPELELNCNSKMGGADHLKAATM